VVYPQVVAAVEEKHRAVASVKLDEVVAADNAAWVVRNGDDEVEDDVVGQHVEEVLAIDEFRQAALDDPEERIQGAEVVHILNHSTLSGKLS
jgi:hypothetical protein